MTDDHGFETWPRTEGLTEMQDFAAWAREKHFADVLGRRMAYVGRH